jgi:O-antigen/teichoic acid export membrane protein
LQLSRILSKIFQVFFLAVAARFLGIGGFGQWSLIFLLVGFFGLIADFGVDRLTVRDVARNLDRARKYLMNTLAFKCLVLIPSTCLLLVAIRFLDYPDTSFGLFLVQFFAHPDETQILFQLALLLLYIGVWTSPFSSIIQAYEQIYILSFIDIFQGMISSVLGVILLYLGFGIKTLLILYIGIGLVRLIVLIFVARGIVGSIWHPVELHFMRYLIKAAFPFAILGIVAVIHWKVDYFMISKMLGEEELGLYAAAYKVFENIVLIGVTFNAALYPSISALYAESREKLRGVYAKIQKYFIVVSLPVAILGYAFAEEIILFLYGNQYGASVNVMKVLSLGFTVFFFTIPMRLIINNSEFIMKIMPFSVFTTALNIILNLIMIPRFGIIGAAVVTVLAVSVEVLVRIVFIRKIFCEGHHPLKSGWKPLVPAGAMILVVLLLSGIHKYVAGIAGLSTYVYLLYLMGELGREEYVLFIREPVGRLFSRP